MHQITLVKIGNMLNIILLVRPASLSLMFIQDALSAWSAKFFEKQILIYFLLQIGRIAQVITENTNFYSALFLSIIRRL